MTSAEVVLRRSCWILIKFIFEFVKISVWETNKPSAGVAWFVGSVNTLQGGFQPRGTSLVIQCSYVLNTKASGLRSSHKDLQRNVGRYLQHWEPVLWHEIYSHQPVAPSAPSEAFSWERRSQGRSSLTSSGSRVEHGPSGLNTKMIFIFKK